MLDYAHYQVNWFMFCCEQLMEIITLPMAYHNLEEVYEPRGLNR